MNNKLNFILNIVKEYFKIVDLFIKTDKVHGNQVVLYFFVFSACQHFNLVSSDLVHRKQGCIL